MQLAQKEKAILRSGTVEFPAGEAEPIHEHPDEGQLKWAETGILNVPTPRGVWVAPPSWAVWLPAGVPHGGIATGHVLNHNLYISSEHCVGLPARATAVRVTPRLRQALLFVIQARDCYRSRSDDESVLTCVSAELRPTPLAPVRLPLHFGSELEPIVYYFARNPSSTRTLVEWGNTLGIGRRRLLEAVRTRVGTTFGGLCSRLRVLHAIQRLAAGSDVSVIAHELGYQSPSAFVSMFRRELGTTPGRYFRA